MYLNKMIYKNVGPLSDVALEMPFREDGSPKPVIIVGANGSGKTTMISNIVDSLYEIAGKAFDDARKQNNNNTYQFYKIISTDQIKIGEEYLFSYIKYDNSIDYIFKAGNITFETFKELIPDCSGNLNWSEEFNSKNINAEKKQVEEIFFNSIFCFFGADRYEKPSWIGEKYYLNEEPQHPSITPRFVGKMPNPLAVKEVTEDNLQWLLDVIVDSRTDIQS